jgi:hypothetical protein
VPCLSQYNWTYAPWPEKHFLQRTANGSNVLADSHRTLWVRPALQLPVLESAWCLPAWVVSAPVTLLYLSPLLPSPTPSCALLHAKGFACL